MLTQMLGSVQAWFFANGFCQCVVLTSTCSHGLLCRQSRLPSVTSTATGRTWRLILSVRKALGVAWERCGVLFWLEFPVTPALLVRHARLPLHRCLMQARAQVYGPSTTFSTTRCAPPTPVWISPHTATTGWRFLARGGGQQGATRPSWQGLCLSGRAS
jgi:hypothetical protein